MTFMDGIGQGTNSLESKRKKWQTFQLELYYDKGEALELRTGEKGRKRMENTRLAPDWSLKAKWELVCGWIKSLLKKS